MIVDLTLTRANSALRNQHKTSITPTLVVKIEMIARKLAVKQATQTRNRRKELAGPGMKSQKRQ